MKGAEVGKPRPEGRGLMDDGGTYCPITKRTMPINKFYWIPQL